LLLRFGVGCPMTETRPTLDPESRQSIHFGINFVAVPAPDLSMDKVLDFQRALSKAGVDLPSCERSDSKLELKRSAPPLRITVAIIPAPKLGQLRVIAEHPERPLDLFTKEVTAICDVFRATWGIPTQFLGRDVTIRCLYSGPHIEHAFPYLWETLLHQTPADAGMLGRPILGGGLRFVMPPLKEEQPEPTAIEVKIESFLKDAAKLYVETQFSWPKPTSEDQLGKGPQLLKRVEDYIATTLIPFITHGERANDKPAD